jgi:hypothetical protein
VIQARIFLLLLFAAAANLGATNVACPSTATAINDPTLQGGSPAGCTQIDMQFNLIEPVVAQVIDTSDASSAPGDANTYITGVGVAGGTGANSQGLEFSQLGVAFSGGDVDNVSFAEEWNYTFTIGVTDIGGGQISGAYLQLGELNLVNDAFILNVSETICPGTPTFSGACPGSSVINVTSGGAFNQDLALAAPTFTASAQFNVDIEFAGPASSFGLTNFEMGFDESTPEPATWLLMATALATISALQALRTRRSRKQL